jgi:gliding motility-associated-like protein
MKALIFSVFTLFLFHVTSGQEFIFTDMNLDITSVSSCFSCDGGCELSMPDAQEYTYRWNDDSGAILLIETNTTGLSSIQNLCLGSYQVIVSSGSEVLVEAFFSVLEDNVNLGSSGIIYSCSNFETLDFSQILPEYISEGAFWSNGNNQLVQEVNFIDITPYYYLSRVNEGCLNTAIYPVLINEPANPGDGTVYIICEDFEEFDLIEPMGGGPDPNGIWLNSESTEIDGVFNPVTDESETFTYLIDSVLGCNNSFATLSVIKNELPNAGEDQTALVCSLEGVNLNLDDYVDETADAGGVWYDGGNNLINNNLTEIDLEEGLYRYTVIGSVPCTADISYVEVIFIDEVSAGENDTIEVCSNATEVNLDSFLEVGITSFGDWYTPEGELFDGIYNPEEGLDGGYEYHVSAVGCALEMSTVNIVNEQFNFAGEDSLIVFCENGELIDLTQFFSGDELSSGVWLSGESELESQLLIPELGENSFTFRSNHTICPVEQVIVTVFVDDNPTLPQILDLYLCTSDEPTSLMEETGFNNDSWDIQWFDIDNNPISDSLNLEIGGDMELSFVVSSNNSCPNLQSSISVEIEENAFHSQDIAVQLCNTGMAVDLNGLIPDDVASSSYIITDDQGNEINSTVSLSASVESYTFVEQEVNNCVPSQLVLNISVLEFVDAGEDESFVFCEASGTLDLDDLVTVPGEWFVAEIPLVFSELAYSVSNSAVYTFEATNNPICESSQANFQLDFVSGFPYEVIPDVITCLNQPIYINYPVEPSDFDIQWSAQTSAVSTQIELLNLGLGSTLVSYTMSNDVCTLTDSLLITIENIFSPVLSDNMIACSGDEVYISIDAESVNTIWYVDGDFIGEDLMVYQFTADSNSEVTVEALNSIGCSAETSINVTVNQSPLVLINAFDLAQCAPFTVELSNVYGEEDNTTYTWEINNELINLSTYLLEVDEGALFDITLNALSSNGCFSEMSLPSVVEGWSNSHAHFSASENELSYLNPTTEFTNESIEFENLNWFIDDELVETQSEYWQYEFPDEEYVNYEVCLEAITVNNCSSTYCESVFVNTELLVYVPSAFTPNNDGINEVFFPEIKGHTDNDYQLIVFDRWGDVIFLSNDPLEPWVGNVNNGAYFAPSGVYAYSLSVKSNFTAESAHFKGHVTLIR